MLGGMEHETKPIKMKRTTPAERAGVLEQFRQSGLSRKDFAQNHQIELYTLHRWLARARKESAPSQPQFREIPFLSPFPSASWALEIISPAGVTVRFRERPALEELPGILRGMAC